jgi:hypothetical protein
VEERKEKTYAEVQLDFSFVSEISSCPPASSAKERATSASRSLRTRRLEKTLAAARDALLDASLDDLSAHLLSLFEFCEAALTRALDVAPTRKEDVFSAEEYRSLRGIGQAQWLLSDAHAKRAIKSGEGGKGKRGKKGSANSYSSL